MIKIDIKGNTAYILSKLDNTLIRALDEELSYFPLGYEYSPRFIAGRWDGRINLLDKNLTFRVGLIDRVKTFFESKNEEVIVTDFNRYNPNIPIDISRNLEEMGKSPRPYQIRILEESLKVKRGIIRAATGSGKTLTVALIVAAVGKPSIVYVIGKDLLWQFHKFFSDVFRRPIGIIGDGEFDLQDITIASVWTVSQAFGVKAAKEEDEDDEKKVSAANYEAIRQFVANASVSILDECHMGACESIQAIGAAIRSEYTIGCSASPYRDDNADMLVEAIFGKIFIDVSASELIKSGYLVQPIIKFIPIPEAFDLPRHYKAIYKEYITENRTRNDIVVRAAKSLVSQGHVTMILFKEIEHGNRLFKQLSKDTYCKILNGKMTSNVRKAVVDEVMSGKCKLLIASSIFDIGIDIPCLSGLVLAGGGKSSIRALQRIGRTIRPFPGKEYAAIIEFYDNAKYLKNHSKARRKIYEQEPGFEVQWPKGKRR